MNADPPKVFPFTELGEKWNLDPEFAIRPDSTWVMSRVLQRERGYYGYYDPPEDIRDMVENDIIIVEAGYLAEVERSVTYGTAQRGKTCFDVYFQHHLMSCRSDYIVCCRIAVQSHHFARRDIQRRFSVKYDGRYMIDGNARHVLRNQKMLEAWQRDFSPVFRGRDPHT